jgi:hypothetical protein
VACEARKTACGKKMFRGLFTYFIRKIHRGRAIKNARSTYSDDLPILRAQTAPFITAAVRAERPRLRPARRLRKIQPPRYPAPRFKKTMPLRVRKTEGF